MTNKQLEKEIRKDYKDFSVKEQTSEIEDILIWTREAQAEISFKMGYNQALKDIRDGRQHQTLHAIQRKIAREARREVVEFINNLIIGIDGCKFEERFDGDKGCIVLDMNENQWQAKQKEWR